MAHRRSHIAALLAVLWVVGFELMPWLHIALHDHLAPHHHHGDSDLDAEIDEHAADADQHGDDDDHDHHSAPTKGAHWLARSLQHGAHSLEHHGIAVPAPLPALTHPLPVDRRPITLPAIIAIAPVCPPAPHANARGPPEVLSA